MTKKNAAKTAARELTARAGVNYTTALRRVTGGDGSSGPLGGRVLTDELRPGTVTAILSNYGATNLAIALPDLIALRDDRHPGRSASWKNSRLARTTPGWR